MRRFVALAEVLGFYTLIFVSIWMGQRWGLKGQVWIGALILIAGAVFSNFRHGDTLEKMGLAQCWLAPATRLTLKVAGLPLLGLAVWAAFTPTPPVSKLVFWVIGYPVWAFAQEFALLSFAANRFGDACPGRPWTVALLNGILFAAVHFPNPLLMVASIVSGIAFTRIFQKTPHLLPLAFAHAIGGALISWIFLDHYNAMMVGPAYWKHALTLGPHP